MLAKGNVRNFGLGKIIFNVSVHACRQRKIADAAVNGKLRLNHGIPQLNEFACIQLIIFLRSGSIASAVWHCAQGNKIRVCFYTSHAVQNILFHVAGNVIQMQRRTGGVIRTTECSVRSEAIIARFYIYTGLFLINSNRILCVKISFRVKAKGRTRIGKVIVCTARGNRRIRRQIARRARKIIVKKTRASLIQRVACVNKVKFLRADRGNVVLLFHWGHGGAGHSVILCLVGIASAVLAHQDKERRRSP